MPRFGGWNRLIGNFDTAMSIRRRLKILYSAIRGNNERAPIVMERRISQVYQRILGRPPNADEVVHWHYYLEHGLCTVAAFENALRASYEHEAKTANNNRRLVDLGKFKMYVDVTDTDIGAGILKFGRYEEHVTAALVAVLRAGQVLIDICANIGYFSMLAASIVGPSGKVICFEPNVSNLRLLYASIVVNGFENVQVFPLAASDSKRILKMQSFGSNGFLDNVPADPANFQFIQSTIIDELLASEARIDVIKMDIEGYESFALKGMRRLVARHRPTIFTEFSPWHLRRRGGMDPEHYLEELMHQGFHLSVIGPSGSLVSASDGDSIMRLLRDDKDHVDLLATPSELESFASNST